MYHSYKPSWTDSSHGYLWKKEYINPNIASVYVYEYYVNEQIKSIWKQCMILYTLL